MPSRINLVTYRHIECYSDCLGPECRRDLVDDDLSSVIATGIRHEPATEPMSRDFCPQGRPGPAGDEERRRDEWFARNTPTEGEETADLLCDTWRTTHDAHPPFRRFAVEFAMSRGSPAPLPAASSPSEGNVCAGDGPVGRRPSPETTTQGGQHPTVPPELSMALGVERFPNARHWRVDDI